MPLTRSIPIAAGILACLMGGRAQPLPEARTLVAHDFEASTDGWLVSGDTGESGPRLQPSGGHPGGYISHEDEALGEQEQKVTVPAGKPAEITLTYQAP